MHDRLPGTERAKFTMPMHGLSVGCLPLDAQNMVGPHRGEDKVTSSTQLCRHCMPHLEGWADKAMANVVVVVADRSLADIGALPMRRAVGRALPINLRSSFCCESDVHRQDFEDYLHLGHAHVYVTCAGAKPTIVVILSLEHAPRPVDAYKIRKMFSLTPRTLSQTSRGKATRL